MRIAIIGGSSDDEQHLARLCEKAGHSPGFVRARLGALVGSLASPDVLEHTLERLAREVDEPNAPAQDTATAVAELPRPRALIVDATEAADRADAAARVLAAIRRDPYFDRVGTLLLLRADQAGTSSLPGGFDDFVLHPCSAEELTIRVRALRQRRGLLGGAGFGDEVGVVVDETSRDVYVDGRAVQLTAREFALFTYLCEWRGKVLSREHLLARVWGSRYSGGRRTVDIHVRRLRAKLGASLAIETLRGSGYRLRRDPPGTDAALRSGGDDAPPSHATLPFTAQIPEPFSKVS